MIFVEFEEKRRIIRTVVKDISGNVDYEVEKGQPGMPPFHIRKFNEVDTSVVSVYPVMLMQNQKQVYIDGKYVGTFDKDKVDSDAFLAGLAAGKKSRK